jgi:hypothetical protein
MHVVTIAAGAATAGGSVRADDAPGDLRVTVERDTIVVSGRIDDLSGVAVAASEGRVGREDLALRPILREAELLETVPGMIATQHSGDGKSNQMFLRGFNLDHGTDFRTEVEGMPVNMPTHGHGQGYTDVNFLVPELVDRVEFQKGVYWADTGDFGSAGASRFRLASEVASPFLELEVGEDRFRRVVGAGSRAVGPGVLLAGGEVKVYDGPWEKPEDLEKISGIARYSWDATGNRFSILAMGYGNQWQSSDQIPQRLVADGTLSPFGQVDGTLGGDSRRSSLGIQWERNGASATQRADLWVIDYELDLFSNFTYFLEDPVAGDQIEQIDDRTVLGGQFAQQRSWSEDRQRLSLGVQTRTDFVHDVALYRTAERRRVSTTRRDTVLESANGIWGSVGSTWNSKVRTDVGIRADLFYFDVDSKTLAENSGTETGAIVGPKASLVLGPWARTEVYANAGLGFHSNDARGATITIDPGSGEPAQRVDPLVRTRGAEVGVRVSPGNGLHSTVALWGLELDSELVFVGDAGTTEPSGESRRLGVELANFWQVSQELAIDLDVAFTRARFPNAEAGADRIPGALENVLAAGVTWGGRNGLFGAARVRHLGEYPLIEDDSVRAEATTLMNASVGYRFGRVRVAVSALNLLDEEGSDIQYFYPSRVSSEEPAEGIEDIHFHPVEPRQIRTSVGWGL